MNIESELEQLVREFGGGNMSQSGTGWLRASCPFAQWTHRTGKDSKPSFAIKLGADGGYRCLSCGEKGGSRKFVARLEELSGRDMKELRQALRDQAPAGLLSKLNKAMRKAPTLKRVAGISVGSALAPPKMADPVPETDLQLFGPVDRSPVAKSYLEKRGISPKTAEYWELGYHDVSGRLTIPVRDCDGTLRGISGRSLTGQTPPYLHSTGFQRAYYLYGEDHLTAHYQRTGILVEGQFDVLRLASLGYDNVVASLGTAVTEFQVEKICQFFTTLVVFFDGDDAGMEAAKKVYDLITPSMQCYLATDPDGGDPGDAKVENIEAKQGKPPGPFALDAASATC